jgi:RNA polymerase sigma-70 factor, ECF subfamily
MTLRQTPLDDVGRAGSAMGPAVDDQQLVGRIAAGDQTALRALYGRHQGRVFRFVLRFVRQDAIAEELTNEVFLEVWRHAGTFQGKASASTWLLSIAHHRAVSSLRKRREEAWNEETAANIADPDDDPEVVAQKADKGALLRRAMQQLSPEHRAIVDLVYYHEMSIAEVSEVVGIPENTVKTRMFYARKRLSELLKAAGVDRGWP